MRKFPFISFGFFFLSILWFVYITITFGTTENNTILYQNGAILGNCFTPNKWWHLISPIFAHIGGFITGILFGLLELDKNYD